MTELQAQIKVKLDVEEALTRSTLEEGVEAREAAERRRREEQAREDDVTPAPLPVEAEPPSRGTLPGFRTGVAIGAYAVDAHRRVQEQIDRALRARNQAEQVFREGIRYSRMTADALGVAAAVEESFRPDGAAGHARALQNELVRLIAQAEAALDALRPAIAAGEEITKASLALGGDVSGSQIAQLLIEDYRVERLMGQTSRLRGEIARQAVMREFVKSISQGRFFR